MGSGKTTVGRILADRLARPFVDTDEAIESETGRTVRDIFEHDGEETFRTLEARVVADLLARPAPAVVAAAGGVVLAGANRAALRGAGTVVWLQAAPRVLVGRVEAQADGHRPLLDDDAPAALAQMAADREALYREVASMTVDVDGLTPDEVVDAIVEVVA
jgi:shikimate kinase